MADIVSQEQEQQIKKLKRLLEGWRVALLPLKSVILWEQQWHPCAIVGSVSFLYLLIWLMDLNTLTTIAVVGLMLNFVDFIVPVICNSVYGSNAWNGQQEKTFEDICKSIVLTYNKVCHQLQSFYSMRDSSPCMYYLISISMLLMLAWMASAVNNILLMYIVSIVTLLWPGIQQRGMLNTVMGLFNKAPKKLQ